MQASIRFAVAVTAAALVTTLAGQAEATIVSMNVSWSSPIQGYQVDLDLSQTFSGSYTKTTTKGFGLGRATATVNGSSVGRVFCIDVLNFDGGTFTADSRPATDSYSFDTNDSRGITGWGDNPTPDRTEDEFRDQGSISAAGWLAETYQVFAGNDFNKVLGLNFAIYKAVYGARLDINSFTGGNIVDGTIASSDELYWAGYFYSGLVTAGGSSSGRAYWYDNDSLDGYNQDFLRGVPEPSTIGLIGLGLLAVGIRRRRC